MVVFAVGCLASNPTLHAIRYCMNESQRLHHVALTMVPHVGDTHIALLLSHFTDAEAIFRAGRKELETVSGIGSVRARSIKSFNDFSKAEAQLNYAEKNHVQILVRGHQGYPQKLDHCIDAPHILYYRGSASMNSKKVVSVIGTRSPTAYGKDRVVELISALASHNVLVASGMAYGIDTFAHQESVRQGIETIGVLGHGLQTIYPFTNKSLAAEMLGCGGLLTEFVLGTAPDKQNFPRRNRIVAGMADVVVVIESGEKGGSLITAGIANSYNIDVLAYPGRSSDLQSAGCNMLIRTNRAALITCGKELVEFMNWVPRKEPVKAVQQAIFHDLSAEEQRVFDLISEHSPVSVDELIGRSGFKTALVSSVLFSLEMYGLVSPIPGKLYGLST